LNVKTRKNAEVEKKTVIFSRWSTYSDSELWENAGLKTKKFKLFPMENKCGAERISRD